MKHASENLRKIKILHSKSKLLLSQPFLQVSFFLLLFKQMPRGDNPKHMEQKRQDHLRVKEAFIVIFSSILIEMFTKFNIQNSMNPYMQ